MAKKFRFAVQTSNAPTAAAWAEKARRIESLGYSSLLIPDHFNDQLAPMPAMMAAADATTTLRVGGLVLDNDYKHPLVLAKEMATLDVLSGGRAELGLGAGWMKTDYDASGIAYDPPGVRITRFAEGLRIIKGLFADGPVDFAGKHYTITHHEGTPKPVQKPLPVLVGGGGKRVLSIAAREADIVGVNFNLEQGAVNRATMQTGGASTTDEKIDWIKRAAGDRFSDLELNVTVFVAIVTDDPTKIAERIGGGAGMSADEVMESPHYLLGPVDQMVETLQQRRERYGFSYIAFSGDGFEALAPVVAKLAGA
jgi:probable F420-dependent oxidoreductase